MQPAVTPCQPFFVIALERCSARKQPPTQQEHAELDGAYLGN